MYRLTGIFVLLLLAKAAAAQDKEHVKTLSAGAGFQQIIFSDRLASPLVYRGTSLPVFSIGFSNSSRKTFWEVHIDGGSGHALPTRFGKRYFTAPPGDTSLSDYTLSSDYFSFCLEAAYFHRLAGSSANKVHVALGARLKESAWYAGAVADFPWLISRADLSPSVQVQYDKNKFSLDLEAGVSAVSFISREIYALFPKSAEDNNVVSFFKQGSSFVAIGRQTDFTCQLHCTYHLSRSNALQLSWHGEWFRYVKPETITAVDHRILFTFQHRL